MSSSGAVHHQLGHWMLSCAIMPDGSRPILQQQNGRNSDSRTAANIGTWAVEQCTSCNNTCYIIFFMRNKDKYVCQLRNYLSLEPGLESYSFRTFPNRVGFGSTNAANKAVKAWHLETRQGHTSQQIWCAFRVIYQFHIFEQEPFQTGVYMPQS